MSILGDDVFPSLLIGRRRYSLCVFWCNPKKNAYCCALLSNFFLYIDSRAQMFPSEYLFYPNKNITSKCCTLWDYLYGLLWLSSQDVCPGNWWIVWSFITFGSDQICQLAWNRGCYEQGCCPIWLDVFRTINSVRFNVLADVMPAICSMDLCVCG